ncbi:hypothetical protein D3C75_636480 [compost metagenome]
MAPQPQPRRESHQQSGLSPLTLQDPQAPALQQGQCLGLVFPRDQDGQLLPAVPVEPGQAVGHRHPFLRHGLEDAVAHQVPQLVVDGLEVVQIYHAEGEGAAVSQMAGQILIEAAAIEEAGQGIRVGGGDGLLHLVMGALDLLAQQLSGLAHVDAADAHQGDDLDDHLVDGMAQ